MIVVIDIEVITTTPSVNQTEVKSKMENIQILNIDKELSTISATEVVSFSNKDESISNKQYIVSDADEELLILIQFKTFINLKGLKIYSTNNIDIDQDEDVSAPKQVHIYKLKNLNVNFDDLNKLKPDKSISCSQKKIVKGQNINLQKNTTKFQKTKYLAIYIESNQNETEKTVIQAIQLKVSQDKTNKETQSQTVQEILQETVEEKTKEQDKTMTRQPVK